jgi:hypothetical protein
VNHQQESDPMETTVRETIRDRVDQLKTLRDEIRVDLRLAGMDLRHEWKKLEKRIPEATRLAVEIKDASAEALQDLVAELRRFRSRVASYRERQAKTPDQS